MIDRKRRPQGVDARQRPGARLITDLLLTERGGAAFTWGRGDLVQDSEARNRYLAALHDADRGDLRGLLAFVRS